MSSTGIALLSSRCWASATRSAISHCPGGTPVASMKRRRKVRGLMSTLWAMRSTVQSLCSSARMRSSTSESRCRRSGCTGRSMNWAWPPLRWGGITKRRATLFAALTPKSLRTRCSIRSMPAALPADVRMRSSSAYSTSASTWIAGCRWRSTSAYRQCVAARRPSSSPVAASTKAPEQIDARRAPRSQAWRRRCASASGTGTCAPFQPATTIRSACSSKSAGPSAMTRRPPWARSQPGSTAALAKRYQWGPISGRDRPKISATMENSKVHRPS
ncbi:Uncharacterised protein [Comamonas aquatica]|nr:Uncharacterised protein [Comamonas aquatica]